MGLMSGLLVAAFFVVTVPAAWWIYNNMPVWTNPWEEKKNEEE